MIKKILETMQNKEEFVSFLKHCHEKHFLELKRAINLPKAFWEFFS